MKYSLTIASLFSFFVAFAWSSPAFAFTNLSVPFTPQAPFGEWDQPWQDACEETSVLMVDFFYKNNKISQQTAYVEILKILRVKERAFGASYDENAQKVVDMINAFFPWEAWIAEQPTIDHIKSEIDAGRPVILPAYGKSLLNPHFVDGGPYYHMNVISGYDDETEEFIIQEPGTRFGLDFRYPYDRIINAMHDYLPEQRTLFGRQVAIFTRPTATAASLKTDGDNDGLTKEDELRFGSVLWLADSDGDGQLDGAEVMNGRLPTVAGDAPHSPFLIKSSTNPKVYLLENGTKRHIANEEVFIGHGWQWQDVVVLSDTLVSSISSGDTIM
jgi:hypothetical protein